MSSNASTAPVATVAPSAGDGARPERRELPRFRTRRVLGVELAITNYLGAMDFMDAMIAREDRGYVCAAAVHSVMLSQSDPDLAAAQEGSSITVPDGMPLVWACNLLGEKLRDRVYGPELMVRYCRRSVEQDQRVWLYGGRDQRSLLLLADNLRRRFPGIRVVGGYAPPYSSMTVEEEEALAASINKARPDVVWCGLGAPKQEKWMARMRDRLDAPVMAGVGAAFDYISGRVAQAPSWMQDRGLEWTFRIAQEPARLLPRYLYYNPKFMAAFARQYARERRGESVAERH